MKLKKSGFVLVVIIAMAMAGWLAVAFLRYKTDVHFHDAAVAQEPLWISGGSVLILPYDRYLRADWDYGAYELRLAKTENPQNVKYQLWVWSDGVEVAREDRIAFLDKSGPGIEILNKDGQRVVLIGGNVINIRGDAKFLTPKIAATSSGD